MTFAVVKSQGIIVHENVELLFVDQIWGQKDGRYLLKRHR